ncbi:MAG: leucine--tRNA ligase [Candidatus Magasanikbacteria bacterium]|nr:leucine--tRNA ligase [Candidatus Magasanikbacteria bacterium]
MQRMQKYDPKKIEKKWQKYWEKNKTFEVKDDFAHPEKKFYALIEFPFISGVGLHVGHPRPFTAMDVIARKRRMEGYNVLYPIGYDSFGLPTENFAIKTGRPPQEIVLENIANFKRQLKSLGYSFDWSREVDTSDPKYYKWTQWIFLQFFKHGLAYKKNQPINWCPKDKIGLANEEVVNGCCERCGTPTEKRNKDQWMLAITKYADKLLDGLKTVDYITPARVQQENWIGRSEGAVVRFTVILSEAKDPRHGKRDSSAIPQNDNLVVEVFTTRLDTIFSGTFLVIAPEHPLVKQLTTPEQKKTVEKYIQETAQKTDIERTAEEKDKSGVFTGSFALNPATGDKMPVWIADFVLAQYGTGAVFADAHDERDFAMAKKYNIPLRVSIRPTDDEVWQRVQKLEECFPNEGTLVNSDQFDGLTSAEAREKILPWLEQKGMARRKINFKLRDWVFSRQHYWGEPIPLVYCKKCAGWIPLPESELPLKLPEVKKYEPTDTGESPLSAMTDWVNTTCPRCGGPAKRETDTMPNWAGSSWYFLRYCDPDNDKEFASMEKLKYWMGPVIQSAAPVILSEAKDPLTLGERDSSVATTLSQNDSGRGGVDWYNGGMEHTVLHLLYSRFWNQFLYDIGVVPTREPYKKRTSHGMILGPDGEKMSKSRGNVINPDEMIEQFGTDAFRMYIGFMGPFDQAVKWDTNGLVGVRRFLDRVWSLQEKVTDSPTSLRAPLLEERVQSTDTNNPLSSRRGTEGEVSSSVHLTSLLHRTIHKVSADIEGMRFNTAIAALMELSNEMMKEEKISNFQYQVLIQLLSPFAPHIAEELWEKFGNGEMLAFFAWPKFDAELAKESAITIVVQVNGKVRDQLEVPAEISEEDIKAQALASEKVQKWLEGKEPKKVIYVKGKLVSVVI